jgi:hypothetical protein
VAIPFSVRAGALAAVSALAVLLLTFASPARAERPGWYSAPSIVSGSPAVGSTLSGSDGGLRCDPACTPAGPNPDTPGTYFQWLVCTAPHGGGKAAPAGGMPDEGGPCPGARIVKAQSNLLKDPAANTYTVRSADAGLSIQLEVIARNYDCGMPNYAAGTQECRYVESHAWSKTLGPIGGSAAPAPSPPPPPAASATPPNMTAYPATTGIAKEGEKLTAANGSWTSSPTGYGYQWKRCAPEWEPCTAIPGATSSTYTLTADDVGKRVQVLVTASNAKGSNAAASLPTDVVLTSAVAPANTAAPAIAGVLEDRQTLTASPGTWTGTETIAFAYQWLRCSTKLAGCTAIEGATNATYAIVREDLAARLMVTVTATNRAGTATASSVGTEHIGPAKPRPGADRLPVDELDANVGLRVSDVRLARAGVRPRGTVAVTVRVTDRRGFLIEGAAVTVSGPGGAIVRGVTVSTDASGTAVVRLRAGAKLPKRAFALTIAVAKPGETATATKRVTVTVLDK